MLPLPPPRLSTITEVCRILPSGSASMRAAMSVVPPAAVGTTSVTGLPASCARTGLSQAAVLSPATVSRVLREMKVMVLKGGFGNLYQIQVMRFVSSRSFGQVAVLQAGSKASCRVPVNSSLMPMPPSVRPHKAAVHAGR
jgi:hypothetical protein